jgi:hypothetical protein
MRRPYRRERFRFRGFDSVSPCVRIVVGFSEGDEVPRIVHLYSFFPEGPKARRGAPAGARLSHMDLQLPN